MMRRGVSAVGSAQHWQCWGHGFKSRTLHTKSTSRLGGVLFVYLRFGLGNVVYCVIRSLSFLLYKKSWTILSNSVHSGSVWQDALRGQL